MQFKFVLHPEIQSLIHLEFSKMNNVFFKNLFPFNFKVQSYARRGKQTSRGVWKQLDEAVNQFKNKGQRPKIVTD